jgi:hypothetical protein
MVLAAGLGAGKPIAFLPGAASAGAGGCVTVAGDCGATRGFAFAAGDACWARPVLVAAAKTATMPAINPNLFKSLSTKWRDRAVAST